MFLLLVLWIMFFLISFIFRSIIGYQRQKIHRMRQHPGGETHHVHVEPDSGFSEKSGPPVETFQDPVCGIYLPESAAVVKNIYGRTVYFCSEKCARTYLAEHTPKTERPGIRPEVKPFTV